MSFDIIKIRDRIDERILHNIFTILTGSKLKKIYIFPLITYSIIDKAL